ncbi:hypothetical protein C8P63_11522 [Melghirimyces profundicolus]|uniref:DUF503 domain-containing protein n=1 Tax=Melghirimyces profundicolus TaxID=1242148 RepID=A0A2T6BRF1_9BACL|nr:DUF503 domain-containing protein [Melghirimyces profundicolus]PTX58624.1 hypothetical protein C8P63_11522 [Melghirimyces profundicolus]
MHVGVLDCRCKILGSTSLKEKRRAVKSGLSRIRHRLNLSASEVGSQDDRQWADLAIAGVGSDRSIVEKELREAMRLLETIDGMEIVEAEIAFL